MQSISNTQQFQSLNTSLPVKTSYDKTSFAKATDGFQDVVNLSTKTQEPKSKWQKMKKYLVGGLVALGTTFAVFCGIKYRKFNKIKQAEAEGRRILENESKRTEEVNRGEELLKSQPEIKEQVIKPATVNEEYQNTIDRIRNSKTESGYSFYDFDKNLSYYQSDSSIADLKSVIEPEDYGLFPYVGYADISDLINKHLTGRLRNGDNFILPKDKSVMDDVVNALDYSLEKLDEKVGKYSGITYRAGYMSEEAGQYFSTTADPYFAANKLGLEYSNGRLARYNVIRTKNGHKIFEFQKKLGSEHFAPEQEVLVGRTAKFRRVPVEECDKELLKAREELASNFCKGQAKQVISGEKDSINGLSKEDILSYIDIWEEI